MMTIVTEMVSEKDLNGQKLHIYKDIAYELRFGYKSVFI